MVEGVGYWQKLSTPTLRFVGFSITDDTIQVKTGWNIVGSISSPFAVNEIQSLPGGITISNVFGYNGTNYFTTDTIYPGRGYWVKVNEDASLILPALEEISFQREILSVNSQMASRVNIVGIDELPPPLPISPREYSHSVQKIPNEFALEQNYPNSFNPRTTIQYDLPSKSRIVLKIYNLLGVVVATLVEEIQEAGYQSVEWDAANIASGVYFYHIDAVSLEEEGISFSQVKKMVVIR